MGAVECIREGGAAADRWCALRYWALRPSALEGPAETLRMRCARTDAGLRRGAQRLRRPRERDLKASRASTRSKDLDHHSGFPKFRRRVSGAKRLRADRLGEGVGMSAQLSTHVFGFVLASSFLAVALGSLGSPAFAASSGWAGETILSIPNNSAGGWEPAIAADRSAPYVYSAWMQYPGPQIDYRVSTNGGSTWGPTAALCAQCGGSGQHVSRLRLRATRRVRVVHDRQRDQLHQLHEPRFELVRTGQGLGEVLGRQAWDRGQRQRFGRLHHTRPRAGTSTR